MHTLYSLILGCLTAFWLFLLAFSITENWISVTIWEVNMQTLYNMMHHLQVCILILGHFAATGRSSPWLPFSISSVSLTDTSTYSFHCIVLITVATQNSNKFILMHNWHDIFCLKVRYTYIETCELSYHVYIASVLVI